MRRRSWIWAVSAIAVAGVGLSVTWYVIAWREGAGDPLPSQRSADIALERAADGLRSQNEALFLSSVDDDEPGARNAWNQCSAAFVSGYDVYVQNDVGEDDTAVTVIAADGTQVCAVALEWTPTAGWSVS